MRKLAGCILLLSTFGCGVGAETSTENADPPASDAVPTSAAPASEYGTSQQGLYYYFTKHVDKPCYQYFSPTNTCRAQGYTGGWVKTVTACWQANGTWWHEIFYTCYLRA